MRIRTTITLDEDVVERLKERSRARGTSFKQTVNEVLRSGLLADETVKKRKFKVKPFAMGLMPGLSYDSTSELLEVAEGPSHR